MKNKDESDANHRFRVALPTVGRFAESEEIANVIVFLASARASFVDGANYMVDGGYICI